jgi:hypothetical protein
MKRMLVPLLLAFPIAAADLDFKEAFADPATREAALVRLVPRSREWFFHQALHHQLAGRQDEFRRVMEEWKAAATRRDAPVSDEGYRTLETRELLLRYEADPQRSTEGLVRMLDLKFDDPQPDARAEEKLPDRLDPARIAATAFEAAADARSDGRGYQCFSPERLLAELEKLETFDEVKLRHFDQALRRADHPAVVPLIVKVLSLERPPEFGSSAIHDLLTRGQLDELAAAIPAVRSNERFAVRYLTTLLPGAETDFTTDPAAHAAHLAACREALRDAPPALNSLKAHVLFHHLRLQREIGNRSLEDLLAYLRLPRASHPLLIVRGPDPAAPRVDPGRDYAAATGCPPLRDDHALVEDYLAHFLASADSPAAFADLVEESRLRRLHARAKLLAGADPVRWGAALDPAEVLALQKETRIAFAPGQPLLLPAEAAVKVALDLKHTPELLVRVFELDLPAWMLREEAEPEVGMDLAGLVPHHERTIAYAQPPLVTHREVLDLPELTGPGAWLVEFVSRGVSARTLVRKGRLVPYVERVARGQSVRVFNGDGALLKDAVVQLGGETFSAGADGRILIPDTNGDSRASGLARHGKLAVPLVLEPRQEQLGFEARFHLDREQLLADRQATLFLRPQLTSHGHELPLEWIENPTLTLVAKLAGGVTTERVLGGDLKLAPRMFVPFQVPADALSLTLRLTGTVTPRDGADPQPLRAEHRYEMNGMLATGRIAAAFFTRDTDGHRLELRGRNGEALPARALNFTLHHRHHLQPLETTLRTDAGGIIRLGALADIKEISVRGADLGTTSFFPDDDGGWVFWPDHLQLAANEEVRLPLARFMAMPDRTRVQLVETRGDTVLRDHFDKLAVDQRRLLLRGLAAGDYRLTVDGRSCRVRVSGGIDRDGLLVSPTRLMPRHAPLLPLVAAATEEAGTLVVRIDGATPGTRVSLLGSRFLHAWDAGEALQPFAPPSSDLLEPGFTACAYLLDRRLSDDMRYIIDRRAAKTYPGSMLPRPGLLVNRWSEEDLAQVAQTGGEGGSGAGNIAVQPPSAKRLPRPAAESRSTGEDGGPTIDFLAAPSVVRYDLEIGARGTVEIPAAEFAGCQVIDIIAASPQGRHHLTLPLRPSATPLRDRRLPRPLDPAKHHIGTRRAAVLAKGAEAEIESVIDADWRAFTTMTEAHQFLFGATGDERLARFQPLLDWPALDEKAKLAFLSEHACHELHLFLARKDAGFFEKHVKPLLAEKREPEVIDDILLGRDLAKYLRPYHWQRLNAAEKALLAQAMPEIRERIAAELKLRWELEAPTPEQETMLFTRTLRGTDLATDGGPGLAGNESLLPLPLDASIDTGLTGSSSYLIQKLRDIVIPVIDFEDTSLEEAIDFLSIRTRELDRGELDHTKKGVNFVIRRPRVADAGLDANLGGAADIGALRIDQLTLRNVPLAEALRYICDKLKLRYKVDEYAVVIAPVTETDEDLVTRTFRVPPGFLKSLGESGLATPGDLTDRLSGLGIRFPEGSSATYFPGNRSLIVRNTPTNHDMVELVVSQLQASAGDEPAAADPFTEATAPGMLSSRKDAADDPFADMEGKLARPRAARPSWSSERDQTRLWLESNYYRHRGPTDESFIPLNRFWLDLAGWDGKGAFLSPHFNACTANANEALFCLAMIDLPFRAERPETRVEGSTLKVKAREPMLLFYKDTRETNKAAEDTSVLVRQTFHRLDDRFRTVEGRQVENNIAGEFIAGVAYGASLVVTNPDGAGRRIDVLAQIPAGAMPLGGQPATLSTTHELPPYGVVNLQLAFYFPAAGDFTVYPLQVSEEDTVLARSPARSLKVVAEPPAADASSWPVLARDGTAEAVLERLRSANLATLDLRLIRWRLRDAGFFRRVLPVLRERLHHSADVASFGFLHDSLPAIRDYLEGTEWTLELGQWLESPLLDIRPGTHRGWETLEFDPLVNPRAHRFADKERLTHEAAAKHYEGLLDQLAWKPALSDDDRLVLTSHLLLQDRVEEAMQRFQEVDPAQLPARLGYDYLKAVLHFHRAEPEEARAIAARHADLPPGLWKSRFDAVLSQAAEIVALKQPRPLEPVEEKQAAPSLDLELGSDGALVLKHERLEKAALSLFRVDLEVLFTRSPFLSGDGASLPGIVPNDTREVVLQGAETRVELPEGYRTGNLLVAADAGGTKLLKVLDSRALETVRQPADRTLQVYDSATRLPLPGTYVKVYVESPHGAVSFHKDGYTDLRGKFDYLSHTGSDTGEIRRIAVLVSHPENGARIETFTP